MKTKAGNPLLPANAPEKVQGFLPFRRLLKANRFILLLVFFFTHPYLKSQTSLISGIVNSYYQVTGILPANDGVQLSVTTGLSQYDKVMIIQMKGATINTSNSVNFGDTTSLNNAGNYEIGTICSIEDDKVYLFFNLLNQYSISGKVQLVKFAEYSSAVVTDTLKAKPWDNVTGTGGVIAINVTDDITLNAPVYADSSGFRGGSFKLSSGSCGNGFPIAVANAYYYDASVLGPQNGAWKGEAVVDLASAQTGGRGAPANGGGGGNNHNNSGGGGGNLSSGGRGGGNSSSAGCTATLRGEAGKALSSWNGKKIFFGGGGGAAHANDGFVSSWGGGHGGGIIFIHANNLISNNSKITANGRNGGPSLSDGASGAGAGGTIIMDVNNSYSGTLSIQANGGAGGTSDDGGNINRCYGGGGGGSGGVIYFTGSPPVATVTTTAGAGGGELARNAGCNAAVSALAGSPGSTVNFYEYARSFDPAGSCHSVLPMELVSFNVRKNGQKVLLKWKLTNPEIIHSFLIESMKEGSWQTIDSIAASTQRFEYVTYDYSPVHGINQYRIRMKELTGEISYSPVRRLNVMEFNVPLVIYPNPATHQILVRGEFAAGSVLRIIDLSGREVWHKKVETNNEAALELPALASGIYFLQLNNVMGKFVVR